MTGATLTALPRPRSLYEQAYEALRGSILSGELSPGERAIETQLARKLNVSRTPIREAIRQLQREALLATDESGGVVVPKLSAADTAHLYDCRIALETQSVRAACEKASPESLHRLAELVARAERLLPAAEAAAFRDLLDLDYQFHRAIAEASGNPWLGDLLDRVFDQMTLLRVQTTSRNPHVLEIRGEHRTIYEAIARRDPQTAVAAISNHLDASRQRVLAEVERQTDF